ncbi:hypothetical protein EJ04DRAFT_124441 [Polyplosphaeria fusca]|uniref:Uncharacterized protein n=1 Tax=Polyplosphaeria fusca TaxID=682080 RepID=A0A9P4R5R7_9PLEO|nr:hypothetical protein EJ04DRAFT_124441 [Polyplosphaeria fusca]
MHFSRRRPTGGRGSAIGASYGQGRGVGRRQSGRGSVGHRLAGANGGCKICRRCDRRCEWWRVGVVCVGCGMRGSGRRKSLLGRRAIKRPCLNGASTKPSLFPFILTPARVPIQTRTHSLPICKLHAFATGSSHYQRHTAQKAGPGSPTEPPTPPRPLSWSLRCAAESLPKVFSSTS